MQRHQAALLLRIFLLGLANDHDLALAVARKGSKQYPKEPWFLFYLAAYDTNHHEQSKSTRLGF